MLLLRPLPICADAGPDLCTFCPDLCTLRLWCYPSINQHKYSPCTYDGGHWLQLALVAFFLQPLVQTLLAPVVVYIINILLHMHNIVYSRSLHLLGRLLGLFPTPSPARTFATTLPFLLSTFSFQHSLLLSTFFSTSSSLSLSLIVSFLT